MRFQQQQSIVVVGDLIADEFVFGSVDRINPEAPAPLLHAGQRELRLGGAANVAHNIVALGGSCLLAGLTGPADEVPALLEQSGIRHELVFDPRCRLSRKTRFIAGDRQLLRVDEEAITPLSSSQAKQVLDIAGQADLIVVSDYGKGVVTQELMDGLRELQKTILVDPKICSPELFHEVDLLKPNLEETKQALRMNVEHEDELVEAASRLQAQYQCNLLITRGKAGMSLFELGERPVHIPSRAKEVYDVTGAGDTVMAALALALASGEGLRESVIVANHAAGIAVSKLGTAAVTAQELAATLEQERGKIKTLAEMREIVAQLRLAGRTIAFTNGCFDILHIGHARLLNRAKSCGDVLVLGLNSDESIHRVKGPSRPIVQEKERAELLSALECVDYIVFFDDDNPCQLIAELQPDVHVKGADYDPDDTQQMPEAALVKQYGGRVEIVELSNGRSTSDLIARLRQS